MINASSAVFIAILAIVAIIVLLLIAKKQVKKSRAEEEKEERLIKEWSASSEVKKDQGNGKKIIETKLKIPKDMGFDLRVLDRFIEGREYREEVIKMTAGCKENDWGYFTFETEVKPNENLLVVAKIYKRAFGENRYLKGEKSQEINT